MWVGVGWLLVAWCFSDGWSAAPSPRLVRHRAAASLIPPHPHSAPLSPPLDAQPCTGVAAASLTQPTLSPLLQRREAGATVWHAGHRTAVALQRLVQQPRVLRTLLGQRRRPPARVLLPSPLLGEPTCPPARLHLPACPPRRASRPAVAGCCTTLPLCASQAARAAIAKGKRCCAPWAAAVRAWGACSPHTCC